MQRQALLYPAGIHRSAFSQTNLIVEWTLNE
jgi:hypothetical protein